MKIQRALSLLKKNSDEESSWLWTRPVTWRGTGAAITLDGHGRMIVVGLHEETFYVPYEYELIEDWEVITSNVILGELFNTRSANKP